MVAVVQRRKWLFTSYTTYFPCPILPELPSFPYIAHLCAFSLDMYQGGNHRNPDSNDRVHLVGRSTIPPVPKSHPSHPHLPSPHPQQRIFPGCPNVSLRSTCYLPTPLITIYTSNWNLMSKCHTLKLNQK